MKIISFLFLCILLTATVTGVAQDLPAGTTQLLENVSEQSEQEIDDEEILQLLLVYKYHPLNINTASESELSNIYFLTPLQIQSLILYRKIFGQLLHRYELQSVPHWDVPTIEKLLPFITVSVSGNTAQKVRTRFTAGEQFLLFRSTMTVEKLKGYEAGENQFKGSRQHQLLRYRFNHQNLLQYGITADKDAGEPLRFSHKTKGFDFYSAHLFARDLGSIKALVIGDFTVNMGQGLVHWQSLAFSKGSEVISIKKQSPVLRPYSSSGEINFHRGMGVTLQKNSFHTTLFASYRKKDAVVVEDTTGMKTVTNFLTSGLHRNEAELLRKNNVEQWAGGGSFSFKKNNIQIGTNVVGYLFSLPIEKTAKPYNIFAMQGGSWLNSGLDYSYTTRNVHFFGEAAIDKNFNKALLNGALMSVSNKTEVALLQRSVSSRYQSVAGKAFTENYLPTNESGFYMGIRFRPVTSLEVSAYADHFKFSWLKYRVDAPSNGVDYWAQIRYQPNKQTEVYVRYRTERKSVNEHFIAANTEFPTAKTKQNIRLHFSWQASPGFALRSRMEVLWYDKYGSDMEEGFLFFTEAFFKHSPKVTANVRIIYFETGGYNSRIYAYENDVLYGGNIPFFSGEGIRYYFNMQFRVAKHYTFSFKASQTVYSGIDTIGNGEEKINGNKKTILRFQLVYQ